MKIKSMFCGMMIIALMLSAGCVSAIVPPADTDTAEPTDEAVFSVVPVSTDAAVEITVFESDIPLFDVYTAESIIPVLAACMESSMLSYPGSSVFPETPVTDEAAYAFLYSYAQANAFVDGFGASLSAYEADELLNLVYGDAYTYADFEKAVHDHRIDVSESDDVFNFGMGECYPPVIKYTQDKDVPLDENTPYIYEYKAAFEEEQSGKIAVYVVPDDSAYCVRIAKIETVGE